MADQLSEEQQKLLRETAAQWQQQDRHAVLTQEEMNTLLSAYESANAPGRLSHHGHKKERQVRLYDFAKPDRFSKEHLRLLQTIHENFSAELSTELSTLCAAATRVDLITMDQVTYKQYRAALPPKTLLAQISMSTMKSEVFIAVGSSIVGVWVDYLCGGNPNIPATPSDLTPLDIAVATKVLEHVLQVYTKAWPGSTSAEAKVERASDAELSDDILDASETVLVCNCEVQTGTSVGMMTICIPAAGVEQMMPEVSAAQSSQPMSKRAEVVPGETAVALNPVPLSCQVILGEATASLSDLANCEVGDVLRLNKRAGEEAEFWVGGRHVFNCRPGSQHGNMAVVISGLADADSLPAKIPEIPRIQAPSFPQIDTTIPGPAEGEDDILATAA